MQDTLRTPPEIIDSIDMLNDRVLRRTSQEPGTERREHERAVCPAEVTISWHHDHPETPAYRHEMIDRSEGGFRIRSAAPLLQGMSGTVLSILPEGKPVDQAVMVAWCQAQEGGGYEIGLRSF